MSLDMPPDGDHWRHMLQWLGVTWILALLGRLVWRIQHARAGQRKLWSWALLWEIPVAAFCGIAGSGLGSWLALEGTQLYALVSVVAYLGPGGIEALANKVIDHKGKP